MDQNCANGGQCYLLMVPEKAKNHVILKIVVIVRLMLCSNETEPFWKVGELLEKSGEGI